MTITDIASIIYLFLMVANGAYQGFWRALIGPCALIFATVLSILYYAGTKNFSMSLVIAIAGQIFFSWLMTLALNKIRFTEAPQPPSLLSRLGGQAVNFVWGSAMVAMVIAILALFPFEQFQLHGVTKDVHRSKAFQIIAPILREKGIDPAAPRSWRANSRMDVKTAETLAADEDVATILADPRVQKLINDPAIQDAISRNDMPSILSNPTIQELSKDPQFLFKVLKVYPKIRSQMNL